MVWRQFGAIFTASEYLALFLALLATFLALLSHFDLAALAAFFPWAFLEVHSKNK